VGSVTVPWGVIAGLAITAALLLGLRLVFDTRWVALCTAIGLLGASALFAVQSTGGSILVPANVAGYTWTFGPVLIGILVLAWPRFERRVTPAAQGNIEIPLQ
jgi:N-acetyl-1-D-myo-inositol-2-amino-2-deoxy-alpha-D-glucopyranoside deacetylase